MKTEEIKAMKEFAEKRTGKEYFPCNKTASKLLEALAAVEGGNELSAALRCKIVDARKKLIDIRNYALQYFRSGHVAMKTVVMKIDELLDAEINTGDDND